MVDFKNNFLFRSCTSKINNSFTNNAENLDIAMSIYNLLKYNNYFVTSWSLRNHYRDEVNDDTNENISDYYSIDNNKTVASESFD